MADKKERKSFLARWSQRKLSVPEEIDSEALLPEEELPDAESPVWTDSEFDEDEPVEHEDDEARENRIAAEAVDIDTLQYQDDFKLFLKRGVPKTLKDQALRKLWRSNPVLANLDGLNDYDANYADPSLNVYKSAWEIGRGFLTKAEQAAQYASGTFKEPEEDDGIETATATDDEKFDEGTFDNAGDDDALRPAKLEEPEISVAEAAADDVVEADVAEPARRVSLRRRLEG